MAVQGADVAQLRTTATQFGKGADALEFSAKALHSLIGSGTQWRGPDAERFRNEWTGMSSRAIAAAVASLRQAADELRRNADQQEQASTAGTGGGVSAPRGARQLLDHIENDQKDDQGNSLGDDDGLRIEKVVGPDGETRLVVYFKGQDTEGVEGRDLARSSGLATGLIGVDEDLTRKIDEALKNCPDGKNTDVMLVGLSQGGMDAQNIAASGKYNVTNLVTFGSPTIQADNPNIQTVHMHAKGDPVPPAGNFGRGLGAAFGNVAQGKYVPGIGLGSFLVDAVSPPSSNFVYDSDPGLGLGMGVHDQGYPDVAQSFDESSDARFTDVKESMKKYEGSVTVVTE